jgi:hypothetical protein
MEGEQLDFQQVQFSIARGVVIEIACGVPSELNVKGLIELLLDATQQYE